MNLARIDIEQWMRIAQDTKKEFHFSKSSQQWYWINRDEEDGFHGPFMFFDAALYDAVKPYLETV